MTDLRARTIDPRLYVWRGLDGRSLEALRLAPSDAGYEVCSYVLNTSSQPFAVEYAFRLDAEWRSRSVDVRLIEGDERNLLIERTGDASWQIDGVRAPHLDGCEEVDLSITPFCNTLALRRFGPPPGAGGELTALYIGFPELVPEPSRQRYERVDERTFKYIDLGARAGFEALVAVDHDGIVTTYEGLFERVAA